MSTSLRISASRPSWLQVISLAVGAVVSCASSDFVATVGALKLQRVMLSSRYITGRYTAPGPGGNEYEYTAKIEQKRNKDDKLVPVEREITPLLTKSGDYFDTQERDTREEYYALIKLKNKENLSATQIELKSKYALKRSIIDGAYRMVMANPYTESRELMYDPNVGTFGLKFSPNTCSMALRYFANREQTTHNNDSAEEKDMIQSVFMAYRGAYDDTDVAPMLEAAKQGLEDLKKDLATFKKAGSLFSRTRRFFRRSTP